MKRLCGGVAVLLVFACCARPSSAQAVTGTIKDQSGRAIKGATISIESREEPATFATTSDRKGRFAVVTLTPGAWYFTVQAPGYEMLDQRVTLTAGRTLNLDVRLTPSPVPSSLAGMTGRQIQERIDAAEASAARGDLDAAIGAYSELLARVPALTTAYLRLGALYERKNDTAAALATYRRLAELEPGNARARAAIERLGQK